MSLYVFIALQMNIIISLLPTPAIAATHGSSHSCHSCISPSTARSDLPFNHEHVCFWDFFGSYLHYCLVLRWGAANRLFWYDSYGTVMYSNYMQSENALSVQPWPGAANVRGLFATPRCYSKRAEAHKSLQISSISCTVNWSPLKYLKSEIGGFS